MTRFSYTFLLFLSLNFIAFSMGSVDIQNIKSININAKFIDLRIDSYDGKDIIVEQLSGEKNNKDMEISKKIINDTLNLNLSDNTSYLFYKFKTKIKISIPKQFIANYIIVSDNSSLDIQNINGNITTNSLNTGIAFKNLNANLDITTSNKVISLSDIIGNINVRSHSSKVFTKNTTGILNITTTLKKIDINNASIINSISTSSATIYADFKNITETSKIVTNDHTITLSIPQKHQYSFSVFGDLINFKNDFQIDDLNDTFDKFLIVGTSNAKIRIKSRD